MVDLARKFESHTVCICRNAVQTDFSRIITFKSVDFQKKCFNFMNFKKYKTMFHGLGQDISCIKDLVVSDFVTLFK